MFLSPAGVPQVTELVNGAGMLEREGAGRQGPRDKYRRKDSRRRQMGHVNRDKKKGRERERQIETQRLQERDCSKNAHLMQIGPWDV